MKPIIFSAPMVQAILDGRKTQTRRVIKDKDITNNFDIDVDGSAYAYINPATGDSCPPTAIAKYQVGDILWVRETWGFVDCDKCGGECCTGAPDNYKGEDGCFVYRANYGTTEDDSFPPSMFKWKPSIHMPREAARIFLKVINVRVERLQDISEDEAIKEGAKAYGQNNCSGTSARIAFAEIWDKTTTEHEWRTNPWVWVYEFEKISKEEADKDEQARRIMQYDAVLRQARQILSGVNVVRCPYCWGKETHSDKCEISKAIETIDKAIGGKEDV